MTSERTQDKYFMEEPKFKIGDLIILPKGGAFLEKKWINDQEYFNKTIRAPDYLIVKTSVICVILNVYGVIYEVLLLTDDLLFKSLVIFVAPFDRTAKILNDDSALQTIYR